MTGRKLTDEDIQAIIIAFNMNESHCRFKGIEPQRLNTYVEFTEALISIIADSKKTFRNTLIKMLLAGIIGLMLLGAGLEIKKIVNP